MDRSVKPIDKQILKKRIRLYASVAAIGAAYLIWLKVTGIGVPCPIRSITGWLCPGCGITTLFMRLFQGDIKGAADANPFVFFTSPLLIFLLAVNEYMVLTKSYRRTMFRKIFDLICIVYVAALIIFGILRNIALM